MSTNTVTITISTEHASGGRESWWRHVRSVDSAQKGGYAFDGDFLKKGEIELPVGALLLHVTHCGSVKNGYQESALFAVEADGSMREVVSGLHWREQAVTLRKAAEAYFATPEPAQPEAAPAGPDWAVLGPRLAEALLGALPTIEDEREAALNAGNGSVALAFASQAIDIRALLAESGITLPA